MRTLLVLCCGALPLLAQPFTFGVKVGAPLTDFVESVRSGNFQSTGNTKRYLAGPTAELRLPFGLGIEFDALYRRLSYNGTGSLANVVSTANATANAWEFPLLAKYRFPSKIVRPYVDAGVAWDNFSGLQQSVTNAVATGISPLTKSTIRGYVAGAGVDIHALVLHISPEIRYTRWGSQHFSGVSGLLQSNQNQAEFMVGITF
jgi:opacity protein-like surface antigen